MTGPGDIGHGPTLDAINERLDQLEANQKVIARELISRSCFQYDELRQILEPGCTETHEQSTPELTRTVAAV